MESEEEARRIGRAVVSSGRDKERELMAVSGEQRAKRHELDKAKYHAAERLDGMAEGIMDALQMALVSEDETVRLKAALALLDRLVPKVAVDRGVTEEVVEVVPESRKRLLEDIEEELKRQREQPDSGSGSL